MYQNFMKILIANQEEDPKEPVMITEEDGKEISSTTKEQFEQALKLAFNCFIKDLQDIKECIDKRYDKWKDRKYTTN